MRIKITESLDFAPPHFLENNGFLDCYENELKESINVSELNDINQIRTTGAINISLTQSKKNKWLFSKNQKEFSCVIFQGDEVTKYNKLKLVKRDDKAGISEIELNAGNDWVYLLKNLKLRDLYFGDVKIAESIMRNGWANPYDENFIFPLLFFGNTVRQNEFSLEDFRPIFFVKSIIQKMFEYCGLVVNCDYLDTKHGKNLVAYILDSKWYEYSQKGIASDYIVNITRSIGLPVTITGTNVYQNIPITGGSGQFLALNNGFWLFDYSINPNNLPMQFSVKGRIDYSFPTNSVVVSQVVEFIVVKQDINGNWLTEATIKKEVGQFQPNFVVFDEIIQVNNGDVVVIQVNCSNTFPFQNSAVIINDLDIEFAPKSKHYIKGDVVNVNESIDKNLTGFDFLKGFIHLINGKMQLEGNEMKILAGFNTQIMGEGVPGAYQNENVYNFPKTDIVENSMIVQYAENEKNNYSVSFKNSTDANIKELPEDEKNLWAFISEGENIIDLENPIFEPSKDFELNPLYSTSPNNAPIIPFLLDNLNLKTSHKIGSRIFLLQGYDKQKEKNGGGFRKYKFEGDIEEKLLYVSQYPESDFATPKMCIVFSKHEQSYYSVFYEKDINLRKKGDLYEIECFIPYNFEKHLNSVLEIYYNGEYGRYLIDSLPNFTHLSKKTTLSLRKL